MSITLEITPEMLAVPELPAREALGDEQQRGAACVWCGRSLNAESAVDLGEQGLPERWFPRACHSCTLAAARAALEEHAPRCEQCVDDPDGCATAAALRLLVRECRP